MLKYQEYKTILITHFCYIDDDSTTPFKTSSTTTSVTTTVGSVISFFCNVMFVHTWIKYSLASIVCIILESFNNEVILTSSSNHGS